MKGELCGVAVMLLLGSGGCTSAPAAPRGLGPTASLVLPSPGAWAGVQAGAGPVSSGWAYGRNDLHLGVGGAAIPRERAWAVIRTRDRTRTSNGRPREFSTTWVRTYRLRQVQ